MQVTYCCVATVSASPFIAYRVYYYYFFFFCILFLPFFPFLRPSDRIRLAHHACTLPARRSVSVHSATGTAETPIRPLNTELIFLLSDHTRQYLYIIYSPISPEPLSYAAVCVVRFACVLYIAACSTGKLRAVFIPS